MELLLLLLLPRGLDPSLSSAEEPLPGAANDDQEASPPEVA